MKDLTALRKALTRRWTFPFSAWKHRQTIAELCDQLDSMPKQEKEWLETLTRLQDDVATAHHAQEMSAKESEVLGRDSTGTKLELRELHEKYAELLKRKEAPEERAARDGLHLAKLEIADLNKRLELERQAHAKSKGHVNQMWNFIALSRRVQTAVPKGSIRELLQEASRR